MFGIATNNETMSPLDQLRADLPTSCPERLGSLEETPALPVLLSPAAKNRNAHTFSSLWLRLCDRANKPSQYTFFERLHLANCRRI